MKALRTAALLLAAVASSSPGLAAGPPRDAVPTPWPGYLADPLDGNGDVREDGRIEFAAGGVALRLTPLDGEARWRWLRERAGAETDPFGERPGEAPRYLSFLLEIRNDSAGIVVFNAGRIWLSGGASEILRPLDLAAMQSAYSIHDRDMPPAYERAGATLLRSDDILQPGERREGLLLFTRFRKDVKGFRMDIPLTLGSGDPVEFSAAWLEEVRLRKKLEKHEKTEARRLRKEQGR